MAQHAAHLPVTRICGLLDVARSGYYAWHQRAPSARQRANEELLTSIREVHTDSHETYGSPRVHAALKAEGKGCSLGRVERLMRANEVRAKARRGFVTTTRPGGAYHPAGNVLDRRFAPGAVAALVADITYLPTAEGFLFLAVVLCLGTREALGWSMSERLHGGLGQEALRMALAHTAQAPGTLHHSDRGGQYVSHAFAAMLQHHGLIPSMSRAGDCYDNAVMESFFATLKGELGPGHPFASRREARELVTEYIEVFYNRCRLHSSLGYVTPEAYAKLLPVSSLCVH